MMDMFKQDWIDENREQLSDLDLEHRCIGGLISQVGSNNLENYYSAVCDWMVGEAFTSSMYCVLYDTIGQLLSDKKPVTLAGLASMFSGIEKDNIARLADYNYKVRRVDFVAYCEVLNDKYIKRRFIHSLGYVLDKLEVSKDELLSKVDNITEDLTQKKISDKVKSSRELSEMTYNGIDEAREIFSTGIVTLDEAMRGGLIAGKMYGMCARKKTGKTVLASTIGYNLAEQGIETFFIACEMTPKEINERVLARRMGRNSGIFLYKEVAKYKEQIAEAISSDNGKLKFHAAAGLTFDKLKAELYKAKRQFDFKVFFLDYLQLIRGKKSSQSTPEFIDEISQWLADFCINENVAGVIIAQMNQDDANRNVRNGEGLRLACSQCYELRKSETKLYVGQQQIDGYYLEMMDTRYTPWMDIGTADHPILVMDNAGPHFREVL